MKKVILVDKNDNQIGTEEKMKAHIEGKLHRCFSIFIFNSKGELLLQKRAKEKYHSGGLWSNTCCSHPRPNKKIEEEAKKRLKEEMGMDSELQEVFSFTYKAKVGDLIENEIDHVFFGTFDGRPKPNPKEVEDWKWVNPDEIKKDMKENPSKYTPWFRTILDRALREFSKNKRVVVGGTFDLLHSGHRALLKKAFQLGKVTIGLSSDNFAKKIKKRKVNNFELRKRGLEDFIKKNFSKKADILKIEDKFGFALDKDFDYIVVSPATHETALMINEKRKQRNKKPIEIAKIEFVLAEDGNPISCTRIAKGEINKQGQLSK
jgi:isopentenyl-diphosphate delta-isomerase